MSAGLVLLAAAVLAVPGKSAAAVRATGPRPGAAQDRRLPVGSVRLMAGLAGLLAVVVGLATGVLLGLVAAVGSGAGVVGLRGWLGRLSGEREYDALIESVGALGGELRAGRPVADAFAATARVTDGVLGEVLADVASAARLGGDPVATLRAAPGLAPVGSAWRVSVDTGAGFADVLDRVEGELRAERDHRRRVAAELAGPRATAALLACLPVLGLALGAGMGVNPIEVLTDTTAGQLALLLGVLLDCLGLWWTARIVRGAERAA